MIMKQIRFTKICKIVDWTKKMLHLKEFPWTGKMTFPPSSYKTLGLRWFCPEPFLVGVPVGSPNSICDFVCLSDVWCYQKLPATWLSILLSKPFYWGQAGATTGVQTAEHVYTECTVLFSLALTWYPNYFARLQFFESCLDQRQVKHI